MGKIKFISIALCAAMMFGGCKNMSNTAKGGLIGTGGGALLGGIIGKIAGNTGVGAAIGGAVGAGAGIIIGKKMDKAAAEAARVQNAKVEQVQDANGLQAVKVTFDSGILFASGKADLSSTAKTSLTKFAQVLNNNKDMDVAIFGYTDATGGDAINLPLSKNRAYAVENYLRDCSVTPAQFKTVEGKGSADMIVETQKACQENRRVEVYMYASEAMIKSAENGTLQ